MPPNAYALEIRSPAMRTAVRDWLMLGLAALVGAGVFSVLLILARTPAIQELIPLIDFFRIALVVHVNLSVLIWLLSMASVLWSLAADVDRVGWDRLSFLLAAAGTAVVVLAPFLGAGDPLMNNYVPLLRHRVFYAGLLLPNQKFTSEITCRIPEGMAVISNGRKVSETKDAATGLVAVTWRQERPHANYLISLCAGYFKKVEDRYRDIPLAFYTPASDINEAQSSFRDTKDMMAFFEEEIGVPYPWPKYDQVVVNDFVAGGMENTSATTLTDST